MYQTRSSEEAELLLTQFAKVSPDILWMFSPNWNDLRFGDEAYERIWGRSLDELTANPAVFLEDVHPDDRDALAERMDALSNEEPIKSAFRILPRDGEDLRHVELEGRPVYEKDGEFIAIAGFIREITQRKRHEQELEAFTSFLSHDLQNQLMVAMGRLDFEMDDVDSDHLAAVSQSLKRMSEMVTDTLLFVRADGHLNRQPISLEAIAHTCWKTTPTDDAELVVTDNPTIEVDTHKFRHVFENLYRNAVVHNPRPITLRVGSLPSRNGIFVEDDGRGIPAEERTNIFEFGYSSGVGADSDSLSRKQSSVPTTPRYP